MSRVAVLLSFERVNDGGHGADVKVDPNGGSPVTAPHFACPGDDSFPLAGDYVALEDSSGSGAEQATGYADVRNAGKARAGEKRIYARDASGATVVEVWLKNDGSIVISNASGSFTLAPSGVVAINGVTIDAQGNISTTGEVTAKGIALSTHVHTSAAPSSPTSGPLPAPVP